MIKFENKLPNFVAFRDTVYTIAPRASYHVGKFKVAGKMSDEISSTTFSFNIIVTNNPPYLEEDLIDQTVNFGEDKTY